MSNSIRPSSRDAIIEAAFSVLSSDPSASLSVIAERSGVGRATLHRHFASREDLIRTLALIAIAEMDEAAEAALKDAPSYAEAFRRLFAVLIPLGDKHGFLALEPIDNDPDISSEYARQERETRELVDEAKADGLFDQSVPTDWIVRAFENLLYAAWESVKSGQATHTQATELAWRTLFSGLKGSRHD